MLCKRMLTVSYYKGNFPYLALLSLQLVFTQWISLKIQHMSPRYFMAQTLVPGNLVSPLKRPEIFLVPMCENRNIFSVNPVFEMAWQDGGVCRLRDKKFAKLTHPVNFFHFKKFPRQNLAALSTNVCLVSTCV